MRKVVLLGYMGSGKSVIAENLAVQMNLPWIDLDQEIEKTTGISVAQLFETKGELYFRKLEHQKLTELLQSENSFILSLGGGTPCYFNNHELLSQVDSIYLKATVTTLYNRLVLEREQRPLLATLPDSELQEFIAKHLFDRAFYYHKANYTVAVDDKSVDEITAAIRAILT